MRYGGASGQLTMRRQRLLHPRLVSACRKINARFSITIRQSASLRNLMAIPEMPGRIPYWMDGAAAVAETTYTPFRTEPDAAPARLIVRRVQPTPGSQWALFANSYHGCITDRDGETLELEADIADAEIEMRLKYGVGLNHLPNGAWLAVQVIAHNLARWTARIGLGEQLGPAAVFSLNPLGAPPHLLPALALGAVTPWRDCALPSGLTAARLPLTRHPAN